MRKRTARVNQRRVIWTPFGVRWNSMPGGRARGGRSWKAMGRGPAVGRTMRAPQ
jgi:hypothetical protein